MAEGEEPCDDCGASPRYRYTSKARGLRISNMCSECINRRRREAYDPKANRSYSLMRRYGINEEEFQRRMKEQGGCAACGSPTTDGRYWHIDHDHSCCPVSARSCGKCVRGILCHGCSTALGNMGDSVDRLRALISYLERFK